MEVIKIAESNDWKEKVRSVLRAGGLVVYPTDTCFALGGLSNNSNAVTKLLEFKDRVIDRSVPIAVNNFSMMESYVEVNSQIETFVKNFTPGAFSIVSKSLNNVDSRLVAENGTLAVRIPNFEQILSLISFLNEPITTTIASNGTFTPYSVESIVSKLPESKLKLIDLILDPGYELPHNPPSTVLDFSSEDLVIHRTGRINPEDMNLLEIFESESVDETISIGKKMIDSIEVNSNPTIILLEGQMGAGKTHLTKGIAEALGIDRVIKSPTYNYVNEYKLESGGKLIHIDAWRIKDKADLDLLKLQDYLEQKNTIVIEWSSVISALDPSFFEKLSFYLCEIIISGEKRKFRFWKKI